MLNGLTKDIKAQFDSVRKETEELGVLDINFSPLKPGDSLDCYEHTLKIIKKNKQRYDQNAGEEN